MKAYKAFGLKNGGHVPRNSGFGHHAFKIHGSKDWFVHLWQQDDQRLVRLKREETENIIMLCTKMESS